MFTAFILCPQVILEYSQKYIFQLQIDSNFYEKYQVSSYWLEKISQTSSALIAVYSYRETNYQISQHSPYYFFYSDDVRILQNEKVIEELEKINDFITQFPYLDYESMIIDDQTIELLENIQSTNVCNFITHFNKSLAQEHCDSVFNGVMKLGIYNSISTLHQQILQKGKFIFGFQTRDYQHIIFSMNFKTFFQQRPVGKIIFYFAELIFYSFIRQAIKCSLIANIS